MFLLEIRAKYSFEYNIDKTAWLAGVIVDETFIFVTFVEFYACIAQSDFT